MPLYIGNDKMKSLYAGGQKIQKAYVGDELVFASAPDSRLPDGYTEVEYISNGSESNINYSPYFMMPNTASAVKMKIKFTLGINPGVSTSENGVFGYTSDTTATAKAYGLYFKSGKLYYNQGAAGSELCAYSADAAYTVLLDSTAKNIIANGDTISRNPGTTWRTSSNYIFRNTRTRCRDIRAFLLQMWDANDELVLDFVPCTDPSGTAGMYDTVGKKFYKNTNTMAAARGNDFTPGPVV